MSARLNTLSQSQIADIHQATLKVLEDTGVWVEQEEAVRLLRDAGCRFDGSIAHIPPRLVEWALSQAPDQVVVSNRNGDEAMILKGSNSYFGPGPTCPGFLDPMTEGRRLLALKDAVQGAVLVDALPNIDYIMSFAEFCDVPAAAADRYEFQVMVTHCTKPIVSLARSKEGLQDILEMAAAVRGGFKELAENPFLVCYPEPISPLKHPNDALDKLLLAAEYGIPIVYTPCSMAGGTAPATIAGLLVTSNAETLSGLVMAQLKHPGVGFITGGVITIMDMATTQISYGAPELDLALAGFTDIAHHYRIPIFGTAGCTDSKVMDEQAALESTASIFMSIFSGANLIHDVGYVESGLSFSFNQMVLGDEIIGMARRVSRGIDVNPCTLAVDVIDQVGPGGEFMTQDHTLRHFRNEHWRPALMDRSHYEVWKKAGAKTLGDRIKERMNRIWATHQVDPLPRETQSKVDQVINRLTFAEIGV